MAGTRPGLTALLTCQSFFSEGRSTVSPGRLVERAAAAGFSAVGLTDHLSVSGAAELCEAAREHNLRSLIGATVPVAFPAPARASSATEIWPLILLARNRTGYARLCEWITHVRMNDLDALPASLLGTAEPGSLVCLTGGLSGFPTALGERHQIPRIVALLRELRSAFRFNLYVQLYHGEAPGEARRLSLLRGLARDLELPVVAAPQVCMASPEDYPLLDALTCARLGTDVSVPHPERPRNACAWVRTPLDWGAKLFFPDALLNAEKLASECALDLSPERLSVPAPRLLPGQTAQSLLETRAFAALPDHYPHRLAEADRRLREELATVRSLEMAGFFLLAAEVTDYCRQHGILAAGRGSAAGSVLCYLLGITLSDPLEHGLLFERFLHTGRAQMPDIDIDIASSRRGQVLAWVEERFGDQGSGEAMVANRVTYRLPSAVQDLGRALGLPKELRDRLSRALGRDYRHHRPHRAREAELVFDEVLGTAPVRETLLRLLERMEPRFVRHLAPHSGGVVLSSRPLTFYSPLMRSSGGLRMLMFDKDDIERLGLVKLDLLGLRMLSALERAREEALRLSGEWVNYGALPDEPQVWRRIAAGDTLGLFQIESPAQTQLAARLHPGDLQALAHQIALIRPGPIQSGSMHPYVRRARGEEPVPKRMEPLRTILASTHGTLLFQEQILRIAVQFAGYSWPEADRFRSRLSRVEDAGELEQLRRQFVLGAALTVGAFPEEAEAVFAECTQFRGYGFAESHSHAFAQHAYASAWMRQHHPAAFLAGVLSEHPGMWPLSTTAQQARRWGVRLEPVCINRSGLNYRALSRDRVRIPLRQLEQVSDDLARRIVLERMQGGAYQSVEDFYDRVACPLPALESLVGARAFDRVDRSKNRREAYYVLHTVAHARPPGQRGLLSVFAPVPELPELGPDDGLLLDLKTAGVSASGRHPLDMHRAALRDLGVQTVASLQHGRRALTAGMIIARQRPPTARGFAFFVLEDATGRVQAIISPELWEAHRALLRDAAALVIQGEARRQGQSVSLRAEILSDLPLGTKVAGYSYG